MTYNDENRRQDFEFFKENYYNFYKQYGEKFLAIQNSKVLGAYDSVLEAIEDLSPTYEIGTYIIQECNGEESAYRTTIMRLMINK